MERLETYRCPHGKRADDYCGDCFLAGEQKCEKCLGPMSDAVAVISGQPPPPGSRDRRTAALVGWRCPKCRHINPDPLSKLK